MQAAGWGVVVPLKPLSAAKTRLRGAVVEVPHHRLVLALALDTVRAVVACPAVGEVLVVTDDLMAAQALRTVGARTTPDRPAAGLNPSIRYAAELVAADRPVAALTADLPALRPAELAAALASATDRAGGYVPDLLGTGTTLLAAPTGTTLVPRFGSDSARRHAATGARRLTGNWPGLRRDVDTAADLAAAARLGLGPHTTGLLPTDWPGADPVAGCYRADMQGTVAEFDPQTHTGSLLLDNGRRVEFNSAAFAASGLRLLRLGQRVHLDYSDDGELVRLTLPTMRGE